VVTAAVVVVTGAAVFLVVMAAEVAEVEAEVEKANGSKRGVDGTWSVKRREKERKEKGKKERKQVRRQDLLALNG